MKKFIVAVVYTGESKNLVPSRWYKIDAPTKSVAASRALAKAQADNPRYSSYSATVDTLSAREIERFNYEFKDFQDVIAWQSDQRDRQLKDLREYIRDWLDRSINWKADEGGLEWYRHEYLPQLRDAFLWLVKLYDGALAREENIWLKMLELRDVING